jgi:hypothetical protein
MVRKRQPNMGLLDSQVVEFEVTSKDANAEDEVEFKLADVVVRDEAEGVDVKLLLVEDRIRGD